MLQFKHPGIYTQELPSGVRTISGAATSVALFVGPTLTGIDGRATRIQNFGDYERGFGGLSQKSSLSYSVMHFFQNGGGEAFVIRVPVEGAVRASTSLLQDRTTPAPGLAMTMRALSSGSGGNEIYVEIDPFEIDAKPFVTPGYDKTIFNLTIMDRLSGRSERFGKLGTTGSRLGTTVVSDPATGSKLIDLAMPTGTAAAEGPRPTGSIYALGPMPTAAFAKPVAILVKVEIPNGAGAFPTTADVSIPVAIVPTGTIVQTPLELVTRMTAAINAEIRGNPAANATMEGVNIEAELFENGRLFRLRTAPPGAQALIKRLSEARVTIAEAATTPATTTAFFTNYAVSLAASTKIEGPSRYRLGAPHTYSGSQVMAAPAALAPVAGTDGNASGQPLTADFKAAVLALETPDPFFNILCLPDLVRPSPAVPNALHHAAAMSIYGEAARICKEKFAFLLIDPFPNVTDVVAAEAWKSGSFTFQSSHAAAYFPNIRVDDPLVPGAIPSLPPSGAIAGVYARTDGDVGVWKAPAGTQASLSGVYGPSALLSDDQHGILNPIGLNVIRQFPIYGTVIFGARTLDGSNAMASEWKYVPVRRMGDYLLRSLSEGLRWAIFMPNGEQLWADIRMNVTSFMQGLFRQGAFKGSSPRDAYFVQCDASTTTDDDINKGIVNIVIGFAPLKPAEFVVISLKQIVKPAA